MTRPVSAIVVPGNGALGRDDVYRVSKRCLALVAEAEQMARELEPIAVVFTGTGWGGKSEAEQMRDAWQGPPVELVVEPAARNTAENAVRTLPLLLARGVHHAVVVCARLHQSRVRFFFASVYGGSGIDTTFAPVGRVPWPTEIVWELAALPLRGRHLAAAVAELDEAT